MAKVKDIARAIGYRISRRLLRVPAINKMIADTVGRNPEIFYQMAKQKGVRKAAVEQRGFINALLQQPGFLQAYRFQLAKAASEHPPLLQATAEHLPDVQPGTLEQPGTHDGLFMGITHWINKSAPRAAYFLASIVEPYPSSAHPSETSPDLDETTKAFLVDAHLADRPLIANDVAEGWLQLRATLAPEDIDLHAASVYLQTQLRSRQPAKLKDLASAAIKNNPVQIYHRPFEYIDKSDLMTILDEIVWHEEYWFASDKDNPVIVDCGANIGLSIIYFKNKFPNAEIIAFEPVKHLRDICMRNLAARDITDVTIVDAALAAVDGETSMAVNENSLAAALLDRRPHLSQTVTELNIVETKRLSGFLTRPIDYLKVDIEGSEFEVFVEAQHKLHLVKRLFCEYHLDNPDAERNLVEFLAILTRAGMRYSIVNAPWARSRGHFRAARHIGKPTSLSIFAEQA